MSSRSPEPQRHTINFSCSSRSFRNSSPTASSAFRIDGKTCIFHQVCTIAHLLNQRHPDTSAQYFSGMTVATRESRLVLAELHKHLLHSVLCPDHDLMTHSRHTLAWFSRRRHLRLWHCGSARMHQEDQRPYKRERKLKSLYIDQETSVRGKDKRTKGFGYSTEMPCLSSIESRRWHSLSIAFVHLAGCLLCST